MISKNLYKSPGRRKSMEKSKYLLGLAGILLPILFFSIIMIKKPSSDTNSNPPPGKNLSEVRNPSAVYCKTLGYEYKIKEGEEGQYGVCVFSNGSKCKGWEFFNGKCGKSFSYCERQGGEIEKIKKTEEGYKETYALCKLSNGTECREWDYFRGRCP